jgi:hypothetical protein
LTRGSSIFGGVKEKGTQPTGLARYGHMKISKNFNIKVITTQDHYELSGRGLLVYEAV